MVWRKVIMSEYCDRCDKLIKPGRRVATDGGRNYCYRCGHALELAYFHRLYGKFDDLAAGHLRAINSRAGATLERLKVDLRSCR